MHSALAQRTNLLRIHTANTILHTLKTCTLNTGHRERDRERGGGEGNVCNHSNDGSDEEDDNIGNSTNLNSDNDEDNDKNTIKKKGARSREGCRGGGERRRGGGR